MRTRTNIYSGEGAEGFCKILKNFYKTGAVDIVFDVGTDTKILADALKKYDYDVMLSPTDDYVGREYFAVAVGKRAFSKVISAARGKFAAFVTFFTADMFAGERHAEFLYFDGGIYNVANKDKTAECYTALLCVAAEGLGEYYRRLRDPYIDKGLKRLLDKARNILVGSDDRDNFVSDCIAVSKEIGEQLAKKSFCVTSMGDKLGGEVGDYAEAACFLHRALILFTKWKFGDMLITVEKFVDGAEAGYPAYTASDLVIGEEEMRKIYSFVEGYRSRNGLKRLINAYKLSASCEDIAFAEIYNRGIYEGILGYD